MPFFLKSLWSELRWMIRTSRPRFWIYLFGPFLIGMVCAVRVLGADRLSTTERIREIGRLSAILFSLITDDLMRFIATEPWYFFWLIGLGILAFGYFLLPANLFLYGINDLFDYETDALNPKKDTYETRLSPKRRVHLLILIVCLQLPWLWAVVVNLIVFPMVLSARYTLALASFAILSFFYSAPPIRAKARPLIDSAFNILYALPALVSYFFILDPAGAGRAPFPWLPFFAGCLWCMAMHAYSAIPDIKADTEAGLQTIATRLGSFLTLVLCLALYTGSAVLAAAAAPTAVLRYILLLLGLPYIILMCISFMRQHDLLPVYKRFPWVNTLVGTVLFFALLLY